MTSHQMGTELRGPHEFELTTHVAVTASPSLADEPAYMVEVAKKLVVGPAQF